MSRRRHVSVGSVNEAAVALFAPAAAFLLAELIHSWLGVTRLSILFLAAVTVSASLSGRRAALVAALLSLVGFKIFLDLRTIEETTPAEDVLNLIIFLIVALITGSLAGKVRDEVAKSQLRAQRMESLFEASRSLSEDDEEHLWPILTSTLADVSCGAAMALDCERQVLTSNGCDGANRSSVIPLADGILASRTTAIAREGHWRARMIDTTGAPAGILVWQAPPDEAELNRVVELLVDLGSASLTRSRMRLEQVQLKASQETAKLGEALLSSISHDFRSPLAAIIGSSTSLLEYGDKFDQATRRDLLLNIQHEGERLNEFVANLLNMTRLQSGVIHPTIEEVEVAQMVNSAVGRLGRHHGQNLAIDLEIDCRVKADPLLLEQALYNVIDNAARYGGSEGPIEVLCETKDGACEIIILDRGPGLAPEDRRSVFNSFHFAKKAGATKGTGLGLSITRGFIEAMGGTVEARDRSDGRNGLEISLKLPLGDSCFA